MTAVLESRSGKFMAVVILPGDDFTPMVLVWGERVFYWAGSSNVPRDANVPARYIETSTWFVGPGSVVRVADPMPR